MLYNCILFDADDTLFHFDAFAGLSRLFSRYELAFDQAEFQRYQQLNQPLWQQYQAGDINAEQLQTRRFLPYAKRLGVSAAELNDEFLLTMADICTLLPGALELLQALSGKAQLGIITNGFTRMQQLRLERCGVAHYFDSLVISEQVGVAKPHPAIFDHALASLGHPAKQHTLMVGDNILADVQGAQQAGMAACWLNHQQQQAPQGIQPDYTVQSLSELQQLLLA
ncbi:pyrimidine 5'-nucleotidase [Rheinheimera sp. 4Y26]|uniref:pyrimidine 5'-nucleotidase n=1 Tax=Rheinheimera sp. 4Y26 TaxID=2977811 RepID=UPI0021B109F5|nr:pyrimidine 5'-nucleotidase [Rheinheimera sp. 4Y26]MCT6701029.1 pyrimidine 5'-nucleotidase [Rheinheimera sp. 4Y26]